MMRLARFAILVRERTEHAKELRRRVGDRGGIKFQDKRMVPRSDAIANTVTSFLKDNLLLMEWSLDEDDEDDLFCLADFADYAD